MPTTSCIWARKDSLYNDSWVKGATTMVYYGSTTGVGDKFIKEDALVFVREKIYQPCRFWGRVSKVEEIRAHAKGVPAKFKLTLNRETFNLTESGKVLKKIDGAGGPKKSALRHMGFALDPSKKGANLCCGLNAIKSTLVEV